MAIITIADIRKEGYKDCDFDDQRIQEAIDDVEAQILQFTKYFFEPTNKTFRETWRGSRDVLLRMPIISIDELRFVNSDDTLQAPLEATDFVVFNRHMTQGLTDPDDRQSPKFGLLFVRPPTVFPRITPSRVAEIIDKRQLNLQITGRFGYTVVDPSVERSIASNAGDAITAPNIITMVNGAFTEADVNGKITVAGAGDPANNVEHTIKRRISNTQVETVESVLVTEGSGFTASIALLPQSGVTPRQVKRAAKLLVADNLVPLADRDHMEQALMQGRVSRMSVRDQSIQFAVDKRATSGSSSTGNIEADRLLIPFRAPPRLAAV